MASTDVELEKQIKEAGKQLLHPPDSVDELLPVLDQVEKLLSKVDQSPKRSMIDALRPSMKALIHDNFLNHSDVDVKVAVASCISEITRITAPDAPYDDKQMRDVFRLIVSSFEGLDEQSSRSYSKRVSILETVSKVRSCVIMLDLECDDLIVKMFEYFLKSVRDFHLHSIFSSMENIMVLVLEESEEIPVEMLKPLLARVKKDQTGVLPVARKLAEGVFLKSANTIKSNLTQTLKSIGESLDIYTKVVTSLCEGAIATVENNDENTSGIQAANESKLEKGSVDETQQTDESKLTTASSDHTDQVANEEIDPAVDRSPKSVMTNGVNEAGNEEASVDQESKKPEEDKSQQPLNKDTDDSDTDKLTKTKSQTEPSDSSHVEGEKVNDKDDDVKDLETEKDNDVKDSENEKDDVVKDSEDEKDDDVKDEKDDVKDSENEKDDDVKDSEDVKDDDDVKESENEKDNGVKESENEAVVTPKATESAPEVTANVSSPSQSNSIPDEKPVRSKKKRVPQEDETVSPSNGRSTADETPVKKVNRSKNKGLMQDSTPDAKKAGKKTVIAKEIEPETVNESEDGEASSDSDAKPLTKSTPKSKSKSKAKSTKQSGKKSKQTGKKVDAKEEESDSDAKPLKTSVKKADKSKIIVEEENESDSDDKPLKSSAKKSNLKKKDTGKKRGKGKNVTEYDQEKSLSADEDDEMDTSPKSVTKSAKGEGNSKETTPATSAKRKRTGKENSDIKYDESLVGTKVKVWWPEDKMFYEGVIEEFYPSNKKHKVSYLDGDEEKLNLRTQRWEILQKFSSRDNKEQTNEASPVTHKKKKSKTDSAPSASQEKLKDSSKKSGAASSSGKSKKVNSTAKSTQKTKEAGKTKEDEETPKTGTKTKAVNKSKGKTPPSGGKSNTEGPTKAKSGSSNVKESDDVKTPDTVKGKSTETAKGGSKSGKKRKKRN